MLGRDPARRDPRRLKRGPAGRHHGIGTAQIGGVEPVRLDQPALDQRRDLVAVDPPVQDVGVARLARQHMKDTAALEIAVLQIFDMIAEHDAGAAAVAIDKGHPVAGPSGRQDGFGNRQDRRHPRSRRQQQDVAAAPVIGIRPVFGVPTVGIGEAPLRRHHVDHVADLQLGDGEAGEKTALDMLDPDAESAFMRRRADRIGAPHLGPVDFGAKRQILTGKIAVGPGKPVRHLEADRHGEIAETLQPVDSQRVELRCHREPCPSGSMRSRGICPRDI